VPADRRDLVHVGEILARVVLGQESDRGRWLGATGQEPPGGKDHDHGPEELPGRLAPAL
jgi:hypothetical protein